MAAQPHRQRRRSHEQAHHPVTERRAGHGDDERRLRRDLRERPDRLVALGGAGLGDADEGEQRHGDQAEHDQRGVSAEKGHGEHVPGVLAHLGAEDAADKAAGQHQRDCLGFEVETRCVGGGEAVILAERIVDSEHQDACAQQPEAVQPQGEAAYACADDTHRSANLETGLPAEPLHEKRGRQRGQRRPDHVSGGRQGGQRLVVGQRKTRQRGQRDQGDIVGEQHRLAAGQQGNVLLCIFHWEGA